MSEPEPGPEDLHLTTPVGRLFALSIAMLLMPLVLLVVFATATATATTDELFAMGLCMFPVAWLVNAGVSGIAAALLGQIGGNLAIWPGRATLDRRRVVALHDWDLDRGWLALQTEATDIPQYRFGTRRDVRRALGSLEGQIPTTTEEDDPLDGFAITCRPGRPHVDLDFAILWSTGVNLLGAVPVAALVLALEPSISTVIALGVFGTPAILIALVLTSLSAWGVQATQRRPQVTVTLRGRSLEIRRRGRTDRTQLDDPARQVGLDSTSGGIRMRVRDPQGHHVCEAFLTRPAADALQKRLEMLEPTQSGTVAEVPETLGRLRAPEGPGT